MYGRNVDFLESARLAFENYFNFSGRAQRAEFWWFQLFMMIVGIVLMVLDIMTFGVTEGGTGFFGAIWSIATFIPSLSIGWRRMHDIGKSGWWSLLPLAPILWTLIAAILSFGMGDGGTMVGIVTILFGIIATIAASIYVIVLCATDSDPNPNRYGPSPKYNFQNDRF